MKKLIAVFGPSDVPRDSTLYHDAMLLGSLLAEHHFVTVCGAYEGVMEAVSRGTREAGGSVVGVSAEVYHARGRAVNDFITREVKVKSANDQLVELVDLADAYVAIGNSSGTLLEVGTAWDYTIKRFIPQKPIILVGETWGRFLEYVAGDPTMNAHASLLHHSATTSDALQQLIHEFGIQDNLPELNVVQR